MLESLLSQTFVDTAWNFIDSVMVLFMVLSTIGVVIATKVYSIAKKSKNKNIQEIATIINDYVIPVLESGQSTVTATKTQQEQIKQIGEILYEFMGEKADEIKDKYQVKLDKLTTDVNATTEQAVKYQQNLNKLISLLEGLKITTTTTNIVNDK